MIKIQIINIKALRKTAAVNFNVNGILMYDPCATCYKRMFDDVNKEIELNCLVVLNLNCSLKKIAEYKIINNL